MRLLFLIVPLLSIAIAAPLASLGKRALNDILLAIENDLPVIDGTIADVADVITTLEIALALVTATSTTQNGFSGPCKELTVLFAKGTADPGNIGFFTGPAWYEAFVNILGSNNVAFQGVQPYDATVDEFLAGGSTVGTMSMAAQIQQAFSQCPSTKLVIGCWSQGCEVLHKAAKLVPAATMAKVSAAVLFGDPLKNTGVVGMDVDKTLTICNVGDDICLGGDLILIPHLTYSFNATVAAQFSVEQAQL